MEMYPANKYARERFLCFFCIQLITKRLFNAMKLYQKTPMALFLCSVVLFDFFTKGLGGILVPEVGPNDFLIVLLLLMTVFPFLNSSKRIVSISAIGAGLLLVFLLAKLLLGALAEGGGLFRDAQLIYRSLVLTVIVFLFWRNVSAARLLFKVWLWLMWFVCVVAWVQGVYSYFGGKLIPYSSGRIILGAEQLTSVFYEPAVMCQFLVASLCIVFRSPDGIRQNKLLCASCILTIIASQSMGGVIGLLLWGLYLLLHRSQTRRALFIKMGTIFLLVVSLSTLLKFFPENRVNRFIRGSEWQVHERSSSTYRRVNTEFYALQMFLVQSSVIKKMVGLSAEGSKIFREEQMLVMEGDDIAGNGLVEFTLRYGILGVLLLTFFFYRISEKRINKFFLLWCFFGLIAQIDGAIGKPWIFTYTMVFVISIRYPPEKVYMSDRMESHREIRSPLKGTSNLSTSSIGSLDIHMNRGKPTV